MVEANTLLESIVRLNHNNVITEMLPLWPQLVGNSKQVKRISGAEEMDQSIEGLLCPSSVLTTHKKARCSPIHLLFPIWEWEQRQENLWGFLNSYSS